MTLQLRQPAGMKRTIVGIVSKEKHFLFSFLLYGGITYLINSFDYPNLL